MLFRFPYFFETIKDGKHSQENLIQNAVTYFIAILVSASLDYILKSNNIYFLNKPLYLYNKLETNTLMSSFKRNLYEAKRIVFSKVKVILEREHLLTEMQSEFYSFVMKDSIMIILNEVQYSNKRNYAEIKNNIVKVLFDEDVIIAKKFIRNNNFRQNVLYNLIWIKSPIIVFIVMKIIWFIQRMKK